jgi:hypothetical protein
MMPVNANIWGNLIKNMFVLEVVGLVSIGLKKKKQGKTYDVMEENYLSVAFCSDFN